MDKMRNDILLHAIDSVLSKNCDSSEYSISGVKDSAICLENVGDDWLVYSSERNTRWDEQSFGTLMEACLDMLGRMGHTPEETKTLKDEFLDAVIIKQTA